MKRAAIYGGVFAALCVMFTICYYISYQNALRKYNERAKEQNEEFLSYLLQYTEENGLLRELAAGENALSEEKSGNGTAKEADQPETVVVDSIRTDTIVPSTKYVLECYDAVADTFSTEELTPPGAFIGMTREEMIDYMKEYMESPPLTEYEKGLVSYELRSFSAEKIVLRKIYDASLLPYKFYVNIVNGYVTVYYSDLKTIYEYTQIDASELSEKDRIALSQGIFVKDREELYGLLEGYSS